MQKFNGTNTAVDQINIFDSPLEGQQMPDPETAANEKVEEKEVEVNSAEVSAPVETVKVSTTETNENNNDNNNNAPVLKGSNYTTKRFGEINPSWMTNIRRKPASNYGLKQFLTALKVFEYDSKTEFNLMETEFDWELGKSQKAPAIWEEGGAVPDGIGTVRGNCLIVTDENGLPIPPITTYRGSDITNGKRALLPVYSGYYVILGGISPLVDTLIGVYRLAPIPAGLETSDGKARLKANLIAFLSGDTFDAMDENQPFSSDHPAIIAALKRIREVDASTPAYVLPYLDRRINLPSSLSKALINDFNEVISDQELRLNMTKSLDLDEAYEEANKILGAANTAMVTNRNAERGQTLLGVYAVCADTIDPKYGSDKVMVFLYGYIYKIRKAPEVSSSRGNRLWGKCVLLTKDKDFYYPDYGKITARKIPEFIEWLRENNNRSLSIFERKVG